MTDPGPLTGSGLLTSWLNRLRQVVLSTRLLRGRGYKLKITPAGTFLEIDPGTSSGLQPHVFVSMDDDFIVCHTWDGTTAGTKDVLIAKPPELQFSIRQETIENELVQYTNYDQKAQTRHATSPTFGEDQEITPLYLPASSGGRFNGYQTLIYAMPARTFINDTDGNPIGLIDTNVGAREWTEFRASGV